MTDDCIEWAIRIFMERTPLPGEIEDLRARCSSTRELRRELMSSLEFYQIQDRDEDAVKLSAREVLWAFRVMLGRDPENERVVEDHLKAYETVVDLRRALLSSPEFKNQHHGVAPVQGSKVVMTFLEGSDVRLYVDLGIPVPTQEILHETYGRAEMDVMRRALSADGVFVDADCGCGYFSLQASRMLGTAGQVLSFASSDVDINLLNRSIAENEIKSISLSPYGDAKNLVTQIRNKWDHITEVDLLHLNLSGQEAVVTPDLLRAKVKKVVCNVRPLLFKNYLAWFAGLQEAGYEIVAGHDESEPVSTVPEAGRVIVAIRKADATLRL